MVFSAPLNCPEPAISIAMLKMLNALDCYGNGCDASTLAYRSAYLIGTVRRCLANTPRRDHHSDLLLASAIADFERRWSSSAVIGSRIDLFQRDSRQFLEMIERRIRSGAPTAGRASSSDAPCPHSALF